MQVLSAHAQAARVWILVLATITLSATPLVAAPLVGVSFGTATDAVLYDIDTTTGLADAPRSLGRDKVAGIAYSSSSNKLYGLTNLASAPDSNALIEINPASGASTLIGSTNLSDIIEGGLAVDPTSGTLYGSYNKDGVNQQLMTIDPTTGSATLLPTGLPGDPSAMAFSLSGVLYVLDTGLETIVEIDKTDGSTISSTPLSLALGGTAGMAVDPDTGIFYVADGDSFGTDSLYTLEPATGQLTLVGSLGIDTGLAGLTFIPEPSSAICLLFSGIWLIRRRLVL